MTFQYSFTVPAPIERVSLFHSRASSMAAITPPPVIVQMHRAPEALVSGSEMEFTLWLGLLPVRWLARIEAVSPAGFIDRQVRGPFAEWEHVHAFTAVDTATTRVDDTITLRLSRRPLWWLVGAGMKLTLPLLFAFRAWKTRRLVGRP